MIDWNEIHVLDANAGYYGVPAPQLMEHAGKGVAEFIINNVKPVDKKILVLCGTGNNGGDGFVAARYLAEKYHVSIFLIGKEKDIRTEISRKNFHKLKNQNIKLHDINSLNGIDDLLSKHDIIIDSMLGIGLSGNLREPYAAIANKINMLDNKMIIAVDVPTGLGSNTAIKPAFTVTFHDIKQGMNTNNSGKITIVDIGIPKKAIDYIGPGDLLAYYPKPKKESHKGDNGTLLVIGGGPYIGAPALAGLAALRTGADLTYIATPKRAGRAITSFSPLIIKPERLAKAIATHSLNLIVKELHHEDLLVPEDIGIIGKLIPKTDTVIIGPGLGSEQPTKEAIEQIIGTCATHKKSMVVDADAIQVVGQHPKAIQHTQSVITPHAGEFKELTGIKLSNNLNERKKHVEKWAKKLGVTIMLKGPTDIISNGKTTKLNDIHNPAMTVGGTGDVLAGIIGALLSKGVEPFHAARMGAFINGSAGNHAFKKHSHGLIATDIIEEIPQILKKYV